jgi:hypothetical protein
MFRTTFSSTGEFSLKKQNSLHFKYRIINTLHLKYVIFILLIVKSIVSKLKVKKKTWQIERLQIQNHYKFCRMVMNTLDMRMIT